MSKPSKLASLGAANAKETIYVDIDDEITGVIDRVTSSKSAIIALVLPKRATMLQSIVNMKLLKLTAETAGKHLVLITSEPNIIPLAGIVGLHVAATPTSKPEIPAAPSIPGDETEQIAETPLAIVDGTTDPAEDFDPEAAAAVPVGTLAAATAEAPILMADEAPEVVQPSELDAAAVVPETPSMRDKKLAVPSFNKFRLIFILGVLAAILLGVGWYVAMIVLPQAGIAITTDSTTVVSDINLTLDTKTSTLDETNAIMPATAQSVTKTSSQDTPTTGQKNTGEKANGTIYFALTDCSSDAVKIPAGTAVTASGNTYITQAPITLSSVEIKIGSIKTCNPTASQSEWSDTAKVIAISGGVKYNIDSGVAVQLPSNIDGASSVSAKVNKAISGGTDNIIKTITQADIDTAKSKLVSQDSAAVQTELQAGLKAKGMLPVASTFVTGEQQVATSANVGDQADSVKVTVTVPYTMLGIKQADLKKLVMQQVATKIDASKQNITDDGVAKAVFGQPSSSSPTSASVAVKVRSVTGPKLSPDSLRSQVASKKAGEIKTELSAIPGVTDVRVAYSPFWVVRAPKDTHKITIIIDGQTK